MSLISKIFMAFFAIVAIALVIGVVGWKSVGDIDTTMNKIVTYELAAESKLNDLETALQAITVAQRTLLNGNLSAEVRADQHSDITREEAVMRKITNEISALFQEGESQVRGWDVIRAQWRTVLPILEKWERTIDEGVKELHDWEATTIMSPDALLRDIMRYRGDHYQLAARLGDMIADEQSSGGDISSADNLCGFGKWRERFESGQEPFAKNPGILRAMDIMTQPHREFHRTAAEVQRLLKDGFEKNQEAIVRMYKDHLKAAQDVINTFDMISQEAERARELYAKADAFTMGEMRRMRSEVLAAISETVRANKANLDANIATALEDGRAGVVLMEVLAGATLILGVAIMIILYITVKRRLTGPLTKVIGDLSSDAGNVQFEAQGVASSSASLSQGSSSQAAALEETSAALEEITSMARKNLDNAKAANDIMQSNTRQIRESTEAVNRMGEAMGEIKDSSEKIGNILKTIEEIAFQTNLLALNAAVEAARAGEAGKGFAVVADEVRNLAQRSAQAVKDTSELINGTVERVRNGAKITEEIEEHFAAISASTDRIARMIAEIDSATSEQTIGMEQVNQSVSQIDQVNQENARHAEANASASINLNERSNNLMEMIGSLGDVLGSIVGRRTVPSTALSGKTVEVTARVSGQSERIKALPAPE